jgi:hypothetical protein
MDQLVAIRNGITCIPAEDHDDRIMQLNKVAYHSSSRRLLDVQRSPLRSL